MDKDFIKENPLLTVSTLVIYFGACAGLWHIGYWSVFDINYFQYIEISDIIKDFAQPLFSSAFTALAFFFAGNFIGSIIGEKFPIISEETAKSEKPEVIKKTVKSYNNFLICLYILFIIVLFLFTDNYSRLRQAAFVLGLGLSFSILKKGFLKSQVPNVQYRFLLVTFVIMLPFFSYFYSKSNGKMIFDNVKYKYISSIVFNEDAGINVANLKVIGANKSNIFLTDYCNKKITIINLDNVNSITYSQFEIEVDQFSVKNLPFYH